VAHFDWNQHWNKKLSTTTTTTRTTKQYLKGVTRVVSTVHPRLIRTYRLQPDPSLEPISNVWSAVRMWRLKVFFLPEPAGMLLLGAGLGCFAVLHRLRRRS
jgi:hypothetical protein